MTATDRLPAEATVRWCRADRVLWRRTLDGVVVLPALGATEPLALRGSAVGIWDLLAEPMTTAELVAALAETYGVHETHLANDVGDALDALLELGALCRS